MNNAFDNDKENKTLCLPGASEKQPRETKISFKDVSSDIFKEITEIKKKNDRLRKRANFLKFAVLIFLTVTYIGVLLYHGQICYSK